MAIRLVLVDDHPIVLQGLEQLFERHADFEVVAAAPTAPRRWMPSKNFSRTFS
jgi:DNA-binding NarL/FixJ family response regulator